MKYLTRGIALALFVILLSLSLSVPAFAEEAFIDNPHWQEISSDTATQMYHQGQSFVVMFFAHDCFNSNLRKVMLNSWMTYYNLDVYGVESRRIPSWAYKTGAMPIICVVDQGKATSFSGSDSMRSIQKRLQEYLGIYDETEIDFTRLNTQIYGNYSLHASTATSQYCMASQDIPSEIRDEAENIVQGLSRDRKKLKAIYDWVTTNIYYNYGMLDGTVPIWTSALETYTNKNSICSGYANLTKTLCNAIGIPCRVVTGFATGVNTESTVEDVWQLYKTYIEKQDLARFTADIARYENHAWNEAYVDGRWIILDTTWGSNNDIYSNGGYIIGTPTDEYFDSDLERFSESHLFWTDYSCDLNVVSNGNQLIVNGTLDGNDVVTTSCCLLVSYDSDGRLLDCTTVTPFGAAFVHRLENHRNISKIKVFLLDDRYAPTTLPFLGKAK